MTPQRFGIGTLGAFGVLVLVHLAAPQSISATAPFGVINLRADIDGRSRLILQGNGIQWQHFDNAAPGREPAVNQPTFIDAVPWFPKWPDDPNRRNEGCDGCLSSLFHPDPPLPPIALFDSLVEVSCRENCSVVEAPSQANGYRLVIEFDDRARGGSAEYQVNVRIAPLVLSIDPVRCYPTKPVKGTKFMPVSGVVVADATFAETRTVDVQKQRDFCLPADKNGEGILDPVAHFERYTFTVPKSQPKHVKRAGIVVMNQFGTLVLDTVKAELLSVPTAKGMLVPHELDDYECYAVKISKGQPKFPKMLQVTIGDEFTSPPQRFVVKKPTRLCTPVVTNAEFTKHSDHFLCYEVKATKGRCAEAAPANAGRGCRTESECGGTKGATSFCTMQAKFAKVLAVPIANQFGAEQVVDAVKPGELCVPSVRLP